MECRCDERGASPHRRLLAGGQLPLRRADLPARQPAPTRAVEAGAREAAAARPLRHHARPEPDLGASEPRDPRPRPGRDLRHRPGPRRAGDRRQRLPRGHLLRALPARLRRRARAARAVPAVLLPRRDPKPRRAGDARLDPRGRRARLRAHPRLRRGVRQPRPRRVLRHRRRRSGDRAAGGELALEQVPEPEDRRSRPADPPPERLQDRQPDRPRADPRGGAGRALRGLRPPADPRHRRRPGAGAPRLRSRARRRARRHRRLQGLGRPDRSGR